MGAIRSALYDLGRRVVPLRWRRAVRRHLPVERIFRIRKALSGPPMLPPAAPGEAPGRPDFILLGPTARGGELAGALAALGARVFAGGAGEAAAPRESPGVFAFRCAGGPAQPGAVGEALEDLAEKFSLREAVVLVEDPSWSSLARTVGARFGWSVREGTLFPERAKSLLQEARASFPRASVIVVTFNNLADNRACLESLRRFTEWPCLELVFVDNASTDGTREWLEEEARADPEGLRIVANPENRGFAAAANQGLALATGQFLCLLNNDTVVTSGWLSSLIGHLRSDSRLGMVGASTNEIANEARVEAGYRDWAGLPGWAARFTRARRGEIVPLPMLAMFCVVFRRALYEEIGPLDERFSVGMFEDDDYCRRIRDAGYRLGCARDAFVHHRGRASFEKLGELRYQSIYRENERRFREKWRGRPGPSASEDELPRALAEASGAVVFLPSIGWSVPLVQRPHQLARALARAGRPVVFDTSNHEQDGVRGFREVESNLFLYGGDGKALAGLRAPYLWSFAYNVPPPGAWPNARLVYDLIDDLGVFPHPRRFLRRNHREALERAVCIFAVSSPLLEEARAERADAVYLPNGVDCDRFEGVDARDGVGRRPVAGYVGALARWVDYGLLAALSEACPDWDFRLVGEELDDSFARSGLARRSNVAYVGARPHAEVPRAIGRFDVGLVPFRLIPETESVSPIKLYEYFAAGRPTLSTPLPEARAIPEVLLFHDLSTGRAALGRGLELSGERDFVERLRERARANDWRVRGAEILRHLV